MPKTFIALAAAAAATVTLVAGTAQAETARRGAFDPLTAGYQVKTGEFCIRSGWGIATAGTHRKVGKGDCRTAADWQKRGLVFDMPKTAAPVAIASR